MNPELGATDANIDSMSRWTTSAADQGAELVLFPECALQGIVFSSPTAARDCAETIDSAAIEAVAELAQSCGVAIVFGLLELLPNSGVANTAAVLLPGGERHFYRKTHLTELGADRWAACGTALSEIISYRGINLGVIICYDVRFPEVTRVLALNGADVILMPTNSPVGYEGTYDHAARTRAWENRVWVVVANRVGDEGGATFIGRSLAVDPFGSVTAQAGSFEEEMLICDVDIDQSRSKLLPGHDGQQYSFLSARRPDLYGPLVATDGLSTGLASDAGIASS